MLEIAQIKNAILEIVRDADVKITNPPLDGLHFEAIVISSLFEGKSLVEQHQLVMNALKDLFSTTLHALSLKTYTPKEWNRERHSTRN